MHYKFHFLWCLAAVGFVLASPVLWAQDGTKVKVRVVSFPKSLETEEVELLIDKDKTIKVETPSNELSKTYTVPVQKVWRLGYTITGDDGKPTFKILGEAPSPASSSQLLLLVRKGSKMADGFKVIPIDYRPSEFDKGEMLFVNATRVSVAGDVGTQKFGLKPGELKIIEPKADETGRLCQAVLYYAKNGRVEPFFSSKWPVNNNSKSLIFVYQGDKDRKLRLHAVRDFSP